MADLQTFDAKVCLTVAGVLVHQHKVLLVKHKKLGIWLNPGGHIETNELPHVAAEREFWEETNIRVKAKKHGFVPEVDDSQYLPTPLLVNLHWVSQENYQARLGQGERSDKTKKDWAKGCEQHLNFVYLVEPVDSVEFSQNLEETDGIAWFGVEDLDTLETRENIRKEVRFALEQANS